VAARTREIGTLRALGFSRRSILALYDALGDARELVFFPGTHSRWRHPRQWNRRMWEFVEWAVGEVSSP
jgi:hypothetical protein